MCMKKEIELYVLTKMIKHKMWGGVHTEERNLLKGLPKHLIGSKDAKKALKELVQLGFLIKQKKTYEDHYSLNVDKEEEIEEFLKPLKKNDDIL